MTTIPSDEIVLFENILSRYNNCGYFSFTSNKDLIIECTASKDAAGVYIVEGFFEDRYRIIYIGYSGKMLQDGNICRRKGGLYSRIVYGHQFKRIKRFKAWPQKMDEQNIAELRVNWYETFNNDLKDIPAYIEALLIQKYFENFHKLPDWNQVY